MPRGRPKQTEPDARALAMIQHRASGKSYGKVAALFGITREGVRHQLLRWAPELVGKFPKQKA